MRIADRFYALALRAYPRDFRVESGEELLGTIADLRDASRDRGALRQTLSLSYSGNRLRWLRATGGSLSQTLRQGVAWGALLLVARQAGLALHDVSRGLFQPWARPSLAAVALAVGWLLAFALLVSGRRRWGLALLGFVIAGFVARSVGLALGYGGPFSMSFTLGFFLPVLLPLSLIYLRPAKPAQLSVPLAAALVVAMAFLPPLTTLLSRGVLGSLAGSVGWNTAALLGWGIQLAFWLALGSIVFLASLSDPRWAVATTLLAFVWLIREFISELGNPSGLASYSGVLMLGTLVPAGALLLSFWARRRAFPHRAR